MSPKKCVFGCEDKVTLFNFPKEPSLLARWTQLVFPGQQRRSCANVFVCSRHFTDDCFTNKAQYEAGFAARLNLKAGALPTVEERESKPRVISFGQVVSCHDGPRLKHTASQTEPLANTASVATQFCELKKSVGTQFNSSASTRSAATQLSLFVLKPHVRSKATQASVASTSAETQTQPASTAVKASTSGDDPTPPKRRRLELEEEVGVSDRPHS